MLVKVCNQIVIAKPFSMYKTSKQERRIIPMDDKSMRYLRFKAIGCLEKAGANGNWDMFPYEHFIDMRPGYGYKSFINKRAHFEHNCLPPGTSILMKDFSYKSIELIEIGDEVWTHDGTIGEVTKTFEYDHTEGLTKLKVEGILKPMFLTGGHPLWIVPNDTKKKAVQKYNNARHNGKRIYSVAESLAFMAHELPPDWKLANDTNVNDYVVIPYPKVTKQINPEVNGKDMARMLGFYTAEGSIGGNRDAWGDPLNQVINFSFNTDETQYIDFITNFFESKGITVKRRISPSSIAFGTDNCTIVSVFSSEYADICNLYCGRNAKKKVLSEDIMLMPDEWQVEFLKAYFEGDANIHADNGIKGSTASEQLAMQIQMMCLMQKVWCNVREFRQHTPNDSYVKNSFGNPIYVFSLTTHEAASLFGDYFKFNSKSKNLPVAKTEYGIIVPVTYKEVLPYEGKVYNFEVTTQNSYVIYNIAVHNSSEGLAGSIGDLPDAFLNKFAFPDDYKDYTWIDLCLSKDLAPIRAEILQLPMQKDGSIEVLMRIDTKLIKSATVKPKVRAALERLIRMIDTGQQLTCSMGCFVPGTQIALPDGTYSKIENVRTGDTVISHKGNLQTVTETLVRSYDGDMLKIGVVGLQKALQLTPEHPVLIKKRFNLCACGCGNRVKTIGGMWLSGHKARVFNMNPNMQYDNTKKKNALDSLKNKYENQLEWVNAEDVDIKDYTAYPIMHNEIPTPNITEGKARLLGYFLAEGSFIKHTPVNGDAYKCGVAFSFGNTEKDKPFIEETAILLKQEFSVNVNKYITKDTPEKRKHIKATTNKNFNVGCAELRVSSRAAADFFDYYCGEYAKNKNLPEEVMSWPKSLQEQLIAAYFNGDGTFVNSGDGTSDRISVVTISETLAYQISYILKRLAIPNALYSSFYEYMANPAYTIEIRGHYQNVLFGKWCYPKARNTTNNTSQSYALSRVSADFIFMPVRSIEHIYYKGPVYNLEIENDNSYIANGVAVHNCNVGYSVCSACGNEARFANEYCSHLGAYKKGGLTIVTANQVRDLLDREKLRPEWLKWICANKFDVKDIINGITNRSVAVRNSEINHILSFFELSVVATPAYPAAVMLEKFARQLQQTGDYAYYKQMIRQQIGDGILLDLYGDLQKDGIISTGCSIS